MFIKNIKRLYSKKTKNIKDKYNNYKSNAKNSKNRIQLCKNN